MSEREPVSLFPPPPERYLRPPDYVPLTVASASPLPVDDVGPLAPPTEQASSPEQERVTLAGRLGQDPKVTTTAKGTVVARFPLGVKDEADVTKTIWHRVYALRAQAAAVRDTLKRGDAVEVVGYRQQRTIPGRRGSRTIDEVYAHVVKKR